MIHPKKDSSWQFAGFDGWVVVDSVFLPCRMICVLSTQRSGTAFNFLVETLRLLQIKALHSLETSGSDYPVTHLPIQWRTFLSSDAPSYPVKHLPIQWRTFLSSEAPSYPVTHLPIQLCTFLSQKNGIFVVLIICALLSVSVEKLMFLSI